MVFLGVRFCTDDLRLWELYREALEIGDKQRSWDADPANKYPIPNEINLTLFLDTNFPDLRRVLAEMRKELSGVRASSQTLVYQGGVLRLYAEEDDLGRNYKISSPVQWNPRCE